MKKPPNLLESYEFIKNALSCFKEKENFLKRTYSIFALKESEQYWVTKN